MCLLIQLLNDSNLDADFWMPYCTILMLSIMYKYKLDTIIYTSLHEEMLQVVSTMQWIQMMICNCLHEAYIHAKRKCHLWEPNMIIIPIDAGEHWLLLDNSMSYAGHWHLIPHLTLMYELLFPESLRITWSEYVTSPFLWKLNVSILLNAWEVHLNAT